jgi:hypothetical protein
MKLKDYTFGFADSETEFTRRPDIFREAFYDPKEILDKLLNSNEFILMGNKGVGKTAYSAKIRSLVESNENLNAHQVTLANFEFDKFSTLSREEYNGSQKFKLAWDLTLLIEIYKFLSSSMDYTSVESFYNIVDFLKDNNLMHLDSINSTVRSFKNIEFMGKYFKLISEKRKLTLVDYSLSELCEYLQRSLCDIDFNGIQNYLIIDGLDDILRHEKLKIEMLSGLFRSIGQINDYLFRKNIPIKIIILAREDILSGITDPDFNKIKRDGGIKLDWNNPNDLMEVVKLRFLLSGVKEDDLDNHWNHIFPPRINHLKSFKYVLQYTLNKPRDILQFLEQCKKEYPQNDKVNYSQLKYIMDQYSTDYFYEEMKNELSGFMLDNDIDNFEIVFSDIGRTDFTYNRFRYVAAKYFSDKNEDYIRKVFNILFDNGYIGQVIEVPYYDKRKKKTLNKSKAMFKHKNPTMKMNLANRFTLHKGLYKAFNLDFEK